MTRTCSLVCAAAFLAGGVAGARAQLLERGGLGFGMTGNIIGAVNETGAPGGAVGAVDDGARGTGANGGMDAVDSMRQNTALASSVQPLLPKGADAAQAAAGFQNHDPVYDNRAHPAQHEYSISESADNRQRPRVTR